MQSTIVEATMIRAHKSYIPFWLIKSQFFLHLPTGARKMILAELSASCHPHVGSYSCESREEIPLGYDTCWPATGKTTKW